MKQTLQLRLGQQLTMTPQLQQAIRLLQLSTLDLQKEIQEALESNLMLETEDEGADSATDPAMLLAGGGGELEAENPPTAADSDGDVDASSLQIPDELPLDSGWDDVYDGYSLGSHAHSQDAGDQDYLLQRSAAPSLHDYLRWQLNCTPFGELDRAIATAVIDSVTPGGYLGSTLEDIRGSLGDENIGLDEVEAVLHRVQNFDPPGIAARDPRECLLIQLRQLPQETPCREQALRLCTEHFELLVAQSHTQIQRQLKVDQEALQEIMRLIRSLHPHPGRLVEESTTEYVVPDVVVRRRRGVWQAELNPEAAPRLRVKRDYAKLVRRADSSEDNTYLKNQLQEARWLIKSLASRNETLLRVAQKIVEFQQDFFEHGREAMRPLVLRDIAEVLEMHESTVSRVTTKKYMNTPRGTLEFKYFFSSHVTTSNGGECSSTAIRALIKKLISAESPSKPFSDNKIAALLSEQGIQVARRTIAKYREAMGIPPSSERKRLM